MSAGNKVERWCCRCGGLIIVNDAQRSISHSYPTCEWFDQVMVEFKPSATRISTQARTESAEPWGKSN